MAKFAFNIKYYNMDKSVIEKKIKEKLDEYGFVESDLTQSELEELKGEVEAELNGQTVIDGVLFNIPYYERIAMRESNLKQNHHKRRDTK